MPLSKCGNCKTIMEKNMLNFSFCSVKVPENSLSIGFATFVSRPKIAKNK